MHHSKFINKKSPFSSAILIAFVATLVVLLIESDFFVYWAVADIFNITNSTVAVTLGILLLVLSLGFILAFIAERYSASKATQVLYVITSIWMGILIYLLFASVAYETIYLIFGRSAFLGKILFVAAIIVSIYGYRHGKKITVKKIEVEIIDLPEIWRNKKAVWVSDFHLGTVRGTKFTKSVVDIINTLSPDIVFIGGDLYDGTHAPDPYLIAKPLEDIKAKYQTIFISGNHEEFDDASPFFDAIKKLGIRILKDEMVILDGLQIIGVDYLNNHSKDKFQKTMDGIAIDTGRAAILLKHEPKDVEVGELAGVSLQISGHTHRGQQWPFNYLVDFIYKGYGYGLKHAGSMKIFVSSGVGGWGPQFRVGSDCEVVQITFK
jgi:predicted MPP superfamily phosphohydrolase